MSVRSSILFCSNCELAESCYSPVPYSGPSPNPFCIIGEAPGVEEDLAMQPFIGNSGKLLRRALDLAAGDSGFSEIFTYLNVVSCFPHGTPSQAHIAACHNNLIMQLEEIEPRFALVLGATALNALVPPSTLPGSSPEGRRTAPLPISVYRGQWIAYRGSWGPLVPSTLNGSSMLLLVTWHPSAILRMGGLGSSRGQEWLEDLTKYVSACEKFQVEKELIVSGG